MDQSYKTFFKDPAPRRRRKKKRRTPQRVRSDWINLCLCLWSMLVVKRVGHCEWCGGTDILSGHHIVTRGSTKGYKLAWFAEDNGITLCRVCHGIAHGRGRHKTVHDYMKFEEGYLAKRGTSYEKLRIKYGVIHKTDEDNLL